VLKLVIHADDDSEREVDVLEGRVRIGRSPDNDVVLTDAAKGVSRTHAELAFENGRWFIVDLNSQNGTWLNGRRVQRAELPLHAEVTLGLYRIRLQPLAEPGTMPHAPAAGESPARSTAPASAPRGAMAPTVPVPVLADSDPPSTEESGQTAERTDEERAAAQTETVFGRIASWFKQGGDR
jgi:predicted component of type VI protein secretion system